MHFRYANKIYFKEYALLFNIYLWLQIKILLVIILTIYHEYLGKCMRLLKSKESTKTSKFFRIINEIPTVLLIFIVFVVVFKPI